MSRLLFLQELLVTVQLILMTRSNISVVLLTCITGETLEVTSTTISTISESPLATVSTIQLSSQLTKIQQLEEQINVLSLQINKPIANRTQTHREQA